MLSTMIGSILVVAVGSSGRGSGGTIIVMHRLHSTTVCVATTLYSTTTSTSTSSSSISISSSSTGGCTIIMHGTAL